MGGVCVVPGCKNVGRHLLPKDTKRKSLWMKAMKLEGRVLKVKYPSICSLHFKDTDYIDSDMGQLHTKRRNLKRHAVPSIFSWHPAPPTKEIMFVSPEELTSLWDSESDKENSDPNDPLIEHTSSETSVAVTDKQSSELSSDIEDNDTVIPFNASGSSKTYSNHNTRLKFVPELPYLVTGIADDDPIQDPLSVVETEEKRDSLVEDYCYMESIDVANNIQITDLEIGEESGNNIESTEDVVKQEDDFTDKSVSAEPATSCMTCGQVPSFSVHSYKNETNMLHFYTGLENFDKLMFVFYSLGSAVKNLNYFYGNPPSHLDSLEQFCMTLLILRRHREFEDVAFTYKTSKKQVTNIFITWIRFMALRWRTIDLWIDRDAVTHYMPLDFHDKYPNTRVIIDATECPIKKPHLPTTQQITFSAYKNRNTVKLLVGLAPSGLITYISPCYGGSASDRQIIERSSILNRFVYNDEIMVDKGLNVQDIFLSNGVKVNMPTFFKKGNQINPITLTRDRKIASKRVHVERIIGMLKTYKILTQAMNQTETLLSSDITFVVAMLVNFRTNIMNKNA